MRLLGKRALLKPVKKKNLGIDEIQWYEVAEVGEELKDLGIKKGDRLFYQMGTRVTIEDQSYQLVDQDEIIAIL